MRSSFWIESSVRITEEFLIHKMNDLQMLRIRVMNTIVKGKKSFIFLNSEMYFQ